MDPNNQTPPGQAPSPGANPYDFILNANNNQKRPVVKLPKGNSMRQRILIALGGLLILLVVTITAFSLLGGGKSNAEIMADFSAQQKELARIAVIGLQKSKSAETRNTASNYYLILTSDQQLFAKFANDKKVSKKVFEEADVRHKNTATDKALDDALKSNSFDSVFAEIMRSKLSTYQQALKEKFNAAKNTAEQKLLQDAFNHVEDLLRQ